MPSLRPILDVDELVERLDPDHDSLSGALATELVTLHRLLYPERHEGFWVEQSEADWPVGWNGPGFTYEWSAETIEWVASGIENVLEAVGLPVDEPVTGLQKLRRDWIDAKDGDSNDAEVEAAAVYIEALEGLVK